MEQNCHHPYLFTAAAVKYQAKGIPVQCRMVSQGHSSLALERRYPVSSPLVMKASDHAVLWKGKPLAVSEASEVGKNTLVSAWAPLPAMSQQANASTNTQRHKNTIWSQRWDQVKYSSKLHFPSHMEAPKQISLGLKRELGWLTMCPEWLAF